MKGLFVGRFQPFHNGHLQVLKQILKDVEKLIIGIGSAQYGFTKDNPFTTEEREEMILRTLSKEGLKNFEIVPIPDVNDDNIWVAHVEGIVPEYDVVFSNNSLVKTLFTNAGKEVKTFSFFKREEYSGTEIRRRILAGEEWENLVPKTVLDFMKEAGGAERINDLDKKSG
ncbi:MAG: nicotinamide-nucleotide adenylyltransferase [Candidatus Hydrothermarchaeales archaeon]